MDLFKTLFGNSQNDTSNQTSTQNPETRFIQANSQNNDIMFIDTTFLPITENNSQTIVNNSDLALFGQPKKYEVLDAEIQRLRNHMSTLSNPREITQGRIILNTKITEYINEAVSQESALEQQIGQIFNEMGNLQQDYQKNKDIILNPQNYFTGVYLKLSNVNQIKSHLEEKNNELEQKIQNFQIKAQQFFIEQNNLQNSIQSYNQEKSALSYYLNKDYFSDIRVHLSQKLQKKVDGLLPMLSQNPLGDIQPALDELDDIRSSLFTALETKLQEDINYLTLIHNFPLYYEEKDIVRCSSIAPDLDKYINSFPDVWTQFEAAKNAPFDAQATINAMKSGWSFSKEVKTFKRDVSRLFQPLIDVVAQGASDPNNGDTIFLDETSPTMHEEPEKTQIEKTEKMAKDLADYFQGIIDHPLVALWKNSSGKTLREALVDKFEHAFTSGKEAKVCLSSNSDNASLQRWSERLTPDPANPYPEFAGSRLWRTAVKSKLANFQQTVCDLDQIACNLPQLMRNALNSEETRYQSIIEKNKIDTNMANDGLTKILQELNNLYQVASKAIEAVLKNVDSFAENTDRRNYDILTTLIAFNAIQQFSQKLDKFSQYASAQLSSSSTDVSPGSFDSEGNQTNVPSNISENRRTKKVPDGYEDNSFFSQAPSFSLGGEVNFAKNGLNPRDSARLGQILDRIAELEQRAGIHTREYYTILHQKLAEVIYGPSSDPDGGISALLESLAKGQDWKRMQPHVKDELNGFEQEIRAMGSKTSSSSSQAMNFSQEMVFQVKGLAHSPFPRRVEASEPPLDEPREKFLVGLVIEAIKKIIDKKQRYPNNPLKEIRLDDIAKKSKYTNGASPLPWSHFEYIRDYIFAIKDGNEIAEGYKFEEEYRSKLRSVFYEQTK